MLSRKHFIEFAGIIQRARSVEDVTVEMVDYFQCENPRFDAEKFVNACSRIDEEHYKRDTD